MCKEVYGEQRQYESKISPEMTNEGEKGDIQCKLEHVVRLVHS